MKSTVEPEFRRIGARLPETKPWSQRWYGRVALLSLSVALLTLSYAPIKQFYLAWVGLIPWLVVIARCRSYKSAIFWGWLSGTMFFIANMWWMAYVTFPGMVGLMAILAAYWGVMAVIVRASGLGLSQAFSGRLTSVGRSEDLSSRAPSALHDDDPLKWADRPSSVSTLGAALIIAFGWTALEFIRGNFIWHGLPWLYLGHTQTPILAVCQIADTLGVYGVTFWLVLLNAIGAAWVMGGFHFDSIRRSLTVAVVLTAFLVLYGVWRIEQTVPLPGPVVMVVQSNYPQSNTGDKGATEEETIQFHYESTRNALLEHPDVDLVVWSETMMPELNKEYRTSLIKSDYEELRTWGKALYKTKDMLDELCMTFHVGLITGGRYVGDWKVVDQHLKTYDTRNAAFFFERSGMMSDLRYDKIHIVPFGEFIPFRQSIPWLYRMMIALGPPDMESYNLNAGDDENLTVFPLRKTSDPLDLSTWRFVTPICFEDIDSDITARMFRPSDDGLKRADVLINLTNDGWFKANENTQHVQAATFRSIENRVPTARSVNTGVSGFIDSVGRAHDLLPVRTAGVSIAKLSLDSRVTFYSKYGDAFAWICVSATASAMLLRVLASRKRRSTKHA